MLTSKCSLSCALALAILVSFLPAQAQRRRGAQKDAVAQEAARPAASPRPASAASDAINEDPPKSGYVPVRVTKTDDITVKIGLAPNAVAFIEFPASDPLYAYHEGNENFAKVDKGDSARGEPKPTDALVIRPGKGFAVPPPGEPVPSTIITVQRVSGVVVAFEIVPVAKASQNANRVVVSYDINAVLEARRKAGLATNLVSASDLQKLGVNLPAPTTPAQNVLASAAAPTPQTPSAGSGTISAPPALQGTVETQAVQSPALSIEDRTIAELRRVGTSNVPLKFGKPIHGISMAVTPNRARTSDVIIEVIAVRNTLSEPIRLVPDQPDIFIEDRSGKGGGPLNSLRIPVMHVATTLGDDDVLQPGATYYFAFAYVSPVLGAKQSLRVVMAQTNASDEPASADLVASAR